MVDQGVLTPCGTPTLFPIAWLQNGKYYAYVLDGIAYIYGIEEHRKAVLFDASGSKFYGSANTQNGNASAFGSNKRGVREKLPP